MRFTLIKDLKKDSSMRPILSGLLIFTTLYLVIDVFVKYVSFGISSTMIELTLFGNEDEFIDPITQASFLEFIHTEIFFIMMILLTLSAIFIRVAKNTKLNFIVMNITMISSILSLIALFLSFFVSKIFISIYIITFFIWHLLSMYMSLVSLWKLYDKSL